jgi:hypothetical protein
MSIDEFGIFKLENIDTPTESYEVFIDAFNSEKWSELTDPIFLIELYVPPPVLSAYTIPIDTSPKFSSKLEDASF